MNTYVYLNRIIEYIEENLENEIDYNKMSKILGVNEYTLRKVFSIICNISIADYIRRRRLSNAGQDLCIGNQKIIDIALKYQYNNPTSFSRAFEKFHGIKPSEAKKHSQQLKIYTKLIFDESIQFNEDMNYNVIERDELILYGVAKATSIQTIHQDAPLFYKEISSEYGFPEYGMVVYESGLRETPIEYWILYIQKMEKMTKYVIPKSKWLQFKIPNQNATDIQDVSDRFYKNVLTSFKYSLRDLPELEYYHDGITEFLVAIEN